MGDEPAGSAATERDVVIDLLRASATTTVVVWHWVFTIIVWRSDGPHADNPIGNVSGLWSLTWVLQVLPLFFFAGGYTHAQAWARRRHSANAWRRFTARRAAQLVVPALVLIAVVVGAAVTIATLRDGGDPWMGRGTTLVLSPLWSVGFATFFVAMRAVWTVPDSPSTLWWVTRPLWLVGPALCTLPLMALSARLHPGMRVVTEPARRSDPAPAAEPA